MRNRRQLIYSFLLIGGVLVLINILSATFFVRLDLTEDKRFTLSEATKKILKEIKQPVTVTAYFSKDLPAELIKTRRDFKDILVEYANRSRNKVVYQFIDPTGNDEDEQKATQAGIQPTLVSVRETNQMKQQKVYIGAVVKVGEKSEVIPQILPGSSMEYALSAAIKKMETTEKPSVGLLQGNGEPSLAGISQAYSALDILYNVEPVYLNDSTYTLNKYKTLAMINPKDTIPEKQLQQIDRYLAEGGNLFIALNHIGISQGSMGTLINNNLVKWLKGKGITVADNAVVDASCGYATAQQQGGVMLQFKFPFLPVITTFPKHPITEGLDAVSMELTSQLSYSGDSSKRFIPLALTSDKSGTQPMPAVFDINKQWGDADFPLKNIVVAAAVVPKSGKGGKIVIVGNGKFGINSDSGQANEQPRRLDAGNVNLLVNSIDWLSDDTGLIDLRTKGAKVRLLDQIDDAKKTFLKYLNFFLPILIIIGYGIYRFNRNRNIRMKRMEAHYV
jgi:gliding-associated putative ABC transporter substrate-binding component GldG